MGELVDRGAEASGLPSLREIEQARARIVGSALRTPLVRLDAGGDGCEVHLKLECLQPIGSFKIRGAANAMAQAPPAELARGVLTASAGNMAQGVAWEARRRGLSCTIIAPDTAPRTKLDAVARYGGRVILEPFERWWQTFETRSYPGVDAYFVHAFDDLQVMAGNGTIGLELLEDLPDLSAVVVPWGGGGLACGIAAAVHAVRPDVRVYAAEVETAAPLAAALAGAGPVAVDYRPSFVDGIGSRMVFPQMLERARPLLAGSIVVGLAEVAGAIRLLAQRARVIAEGASGAAVAAALSGRAGSGKVAAIVSGGNIDLAVLASILSGETPR